MHRFNFLSLAAIILATVSYTKASTFDGQPRFILKAENNKAFHNSSLVKTFKMKSENIVKSENFLDINFI